MIENKITGTEMEWGVVVKDSRRDWKSLDAEIIVEDNLPEDLATIDSFLSNGARYYRDFGNHIEYCTPEDTSYMGTVINELAGEQILKYSLDKLIEENRITKYCAMKRLVDDEGNSWGHHENFISKADKIEIDPRTLSLLSLHLASKNIWAGAGQLQRSDLNRNIFSVSARAKALNIEYSPETTLKKPILNLRKESLASSAWKRIHVTSGDAHMSPWAIWMSLATNSIVIKLIEEKANNLDIDPVGGLLALNYLVASDTSLKKSIDVKNIGKLRPIDIQRMICNKANQLQAHHAIFNDEEQFALSEWTRVLDDLEFGTKNQVIDRVEWIARLLLLKEYSAKNQESSKARTNKLLKIDKLWDNISDEGIAQKYRKTVWKEWMPDQDRINKAIIYPPDTTRAKLRAQFIIENYNLGHQSVKVNWAYLTNKFNRTKTLKPYQTK